MFQLACGQDTFGFKRKAMCLGAGRASKAQGAAEFLQGLFDRSCKLVRTREAMFMLKLEQFKTSSKIPTHARRDRRLLFRSWRLGSLSPPAPLRAELQRFLQADQQPGRLRRFVKAESCLQKPSRRYASTQSCGFLSSSLNRCWGAPQSERWRKSRSKSNVLLGWECRMLP